MVTTGQSSTANTTPPAQPELSEQQNSLILAAAAETIRATVLGRSLSLEDPNLGGAATTSVSGVFVSLKRRGHLRSCCGMFGQPIQLGLAIYDAAQRTARDDPRFPPVSPSELAYLDMEVWLLFAPRLVESTGEDRLADVAVGTHGLQVVRDSARGLLLPGVALEQGYSAEQFLEQVCVKAGLHPSLWKDEKTQLYTFEGRSLQGKVVHAPEEALQPAVLFQPQELAAYVGFCRANIAALLAGSTPSCFFAGASDANIHGVALTLRVAPDQPPITFSRFSVHQAMPMQSSLFSLSDAAARALAQQARAVGAPEALDVQLTVLYDPAMHGTVAEPDLAGIEAERRAVLVAERARTGWIFDPQKSPAELLEVAAAQAHTRTPAMAAVFSLQALSTQPAVSVSSVPQPAAGPAVRPPSVAGTFYPADGQTLSGELDELMAGSEKPVAKKPWPVAIVPHAGWRFSGRLAADVLRQIQFPKTAIVLAPRHTRHGVDWAVAPHERWALPSGEVPSDPELARQLAEAIDGLELDALAHRQEHAIEVLLPLIARLAPETSVVGITIGGGDLDACRQFGAKLAEVLRQRKQRPLLLVSSDMNHYATDAENRRLDELALAALETLDPAKIYETVTGNRISMCGMLPAVIALEALRSLGGCKKCKRVGYATSADANGETSRVVGYAGMLFV